MKRRKSFVEHQDTKDIAGGPDAYDLWMRFKAPIDEYGEHIEHFRANPDSLPETEIAGPSTPQRIMGEAIEHLQGRQKEVYLLTMREDKSLAEVGEILGITKSAAQKYQERAVRFIAQYCKAQIRRGAV